jgi:hypothetical protein
MSFADGFALAISVTAAGFLSGVFAGWIRKPHWVRTKAMVFSIIILIIITALFTTMQTTQGSSAGKSPSPPAGGSATSSSSGAAANEPVKPFIEKKGYVLRRSSSIATNDQDKVDLDTGCPGWGGMHPRLGPSRCGETADLILDEEGIHPADGQPRFIELHSDAEGDYATCRSALTAVPSRSLNQLDVTALRSTDRVCVETDKDNIAFVTVYEVSTDALQALQRLTIDFVVWRPQE